MKNLIGFIILFPFVFPNIIFGQKKVIIQVENEDSSNIGSIRLSEYKQYFSSRTILDKEPLNGRIQNNRTIYEIDSISHPEYIYVESAKLKTGSSRNIARFLPVMPDDNFIVIIKNGKLFFKGRGSVRLTCQSEIEDCRPKSYRRFAKQDDSALNYRYLYLPDSLMQAKLRILNAYKNKMDALSFNLLKYDILGRSSLAAITGVFANAEYLRFSRDKQSLNNFNALHKIFLKYYNAIDTTDPAIRNYSTFYMKFLFENEIINYNISQFIANHNDTIIDAAPAYNLIKRKYTGIIRDNLLTNFAFYLIGHNYVEANGYLTKTFSDVQNPRYKQMLMEALINREAGKPAFGFHLKDTTGKIWSLNDFKGKLVIMDFWFNGCHGCAELERSMRSIFKKYMTEKRVTFLSVNVDGNVRTWKAGIRRGIYTDPQQLLLNVGANGVNSPILKFYNFNAYPQLILIDKNGLVITTNPPRPSLSSKKLTNTFIELIQEHI